jgi:hypothetical protein
VDSNSAPVDAYSGLVYDRSQDAKDLNNNLISRFRASADQLFVLGGLTPKSLQSLMYHNVQLGDIQGDSPAGVRSLLDDKLKALPEQERKKMADLGMGWLGNFDVSPHRDKAGDVNGAQSWRGLDPYRFNVLIQNGGNINIGLKSVLDQYDKDGNKNDLEQKLSYLTNIAREVKLTLDPSLANRALNDLTAYHKDWTFWPQAVAADLVQLGATAPADPAIRSQLNAAPGDLFGWGEALRNKPLQLK